MDIGCLFLSNLLSTGVVGYRVEYSKTLERFLLMISFYNFGHIIEINF